MIIGLLVLLFGWSKNSIQRPWDNDPPSFTSSPITAGKEGEAYSYAVTASDPNLGAGDSMSMSAPTLSGWLNLTYHGAGLATLAGTPGTLHVGDQNVSLKVWDVLGEMDIQNFTITVAADIILYPIYIPLLRK